MMASQGQAAPVTSHGMCLHGEPRYPAGFRHFDYANPQAPKGGQVRLGALGGFDSLNPFINKGNPADGIGQIYDTLTVQSQDEAFCQYGLLASQITRDPDDPSWVTFQLRPEARFHDGKPVTATDVVFTFDLIRRDGDPSYKAYYREIAKVVALDPHRVRFEFKARDNRELPHIVGQLPILPKHYWQQHTFNQTSLAIPLGSGPYRIVQVDPGRSISYERVKNYWGRDLPTQRGLYNFDRLSYRYYRDITIALEAFKAGEYDFREESMAKLWANGYDFPAVADGRVKKEAIVHERPTGMQAFVMNLRRPQFQDLRVRQALNLAFDFEWSNRALFNGAYTRTASYFSNSELAATGLPSPAELQLLEPWRKQLPAAVFTEPFRLPVSDGKGINRPNLLQARELLMQAGWQIRNGRLENAKGEPFRIEILLVQPEFERIVHPFRRNLAKLGIDLRIRIMADIPQYIERLRAFDFDMVVHSWGQSLSPGNEQLDFWTSPAADTKGSRNFIGIKSPVVDDLVSKLIAAHTREDLVTRSRALDRVLLSGWYVIPQWHIRTFRVAYWNKFERPARSPRYALGFETWWLRPSPSVRPES